MKVIKNFNKNETAKQAAEYLNNLLDKFKNKPILLLLSGGSLFNLLSFIDKNNLNKNITVSVLDERYSKDPKINNFAQLSSSEFYRKAKTRECKLIDTQIQGFETVEDLAIRFEKELREWKKKHANGKIIVTIGVGKDGHTAGTMPFPNNKALFKKHFEDNKKWVVGYDAGSKNPYPPRVTVTNIFLRKLINYAIVYVVGKEKKDVLSEILTKNGSLYETPARILKEMKDVRLFTDIT